MSPDRLARGMRVTFSFALVATVALCFPAAGEASHGRASASAGLAGDDDGGQALRPDRDGGSARQRVDPGERRTLKEETGEERGTGAPSHDGEHGHEETPQPPARQSLESHAHGLGAVQLHLNVAELQFRRGATGFHWEGSTSVGSDRDRLIVASKGEGAFGEGVEHGDVQLLFGRTLSPRLVALAGVRRDIGAEVRDIHAVLGLAVHPAAGVDLRTSLFLSERGDATGRVEFHVDHELGGGFILQPAFEFDWSANDLTERSRGAGVSSAEAGLRLRYRAAGGLAPYVGVAWHGAIGKTRRYARLEGEELSATSFVLGLNINF